MEAERGDRALALLEQLLERRGSVIGKDELLEAVWQGKFVGEESLTQAISVIRQALEDDPQRPTYIRTVPRRGYLWLAPIDKPPSSRPEYPSRRKWLVVSSVLTLVMGVAVMGAVLMQRQLAHPAALPTIAVLDFENLGVPEDAYFAAGVTEELTSRLVGVSGLEVISIRATCEIKPTPNERPHVPGEVEADVDYVLTGAVRWAHSSDHPNRVRITPRLMRIEDGAYIWAQAYDREVEDVLAVQSEIAGKVLIELGVRLTDQDRKVLTTAPAATLEAYRARERQRGERD